MSAETSRVANDIVVRENPGARRADGGEGDRVIDDGPQIGSPTRASRGTRS